MTVTPSAAYPPLDSAPAAARLVTCLVCNRPMEVTAEGPIRCPVCAQTGEIYLFTPLPITVEHAQQALPDDATCLHHPNKRATAVCAGTGDYICSLCAIELNGQIYSASYLNSVGKDKVGKAFDRYLDRPDSTIIMCIILCFVPVINYIMIPASIVWLPYCIYLYVKALRMRAANPLFARVMGMARVVLIPIFLGLIAMGILAAAIGLFVWLAFPSYR